MEFESSGVSLLGIVSPRPLEKKKSFSSYKKSDALYYKYALSHVRKHYQTEQETT